MTKEEFSMTSDKIVKYIISVLLGILAWIIQTSYNRQSEAMMALTKDVIEIKLELTKINNSIITEQRVDEMIELKLMKFKESLKHEIYSDLKQ